MKIFPLALLVVALPPAALAQVREDDLRIRAGRDTYEACINAKVGVARAMRGDHRWLQSLVEAECKTEADALYGVVMEWSKEQNPAAGAAGHDTVAAFYVNKVMFNKVYGAGPAAFGAPASSSSGPTGRDDPFSKGDGTTRRR